MEGNEIRRVERELRCLSQEFRHLTGHTAFVMVQSGRSGILFWRFTDETFTDPLRALAHMHSLLQIAREGLADELLWW